MEKNRLYRELDLNLDSLEGKKIIAAKPQEATGKGLIDIINNPGNAGIMWMVEVNPSLGVIKECAESIVKTAQRSTLEFKLAKTILVLIKKPSSRNITEKARPSKPKRRKR